MARVLGILRLSRDGENSTSIERQRDRIEQWAEFNGHTIVGWAEDVDVSGGVAPWERAELGKWLPDTIGARVSEREEQMAWNASRAGEWDIACAWKLDRISRRVLHIVQLDDWARGKGKTLASVEDGFDFTTDMGRLLFTLLAAFAEGELTAIKARQRSSRRHLSQVGRYAGSTPPFGYRAEPAEDGEGFVLVPDETGTATAKVVREMARMILKEGKSANAIALWLNETGQPKAKDAQLIRKEKEPKGSKWAGKDVTSILRSEVILGRSYRAETIETPEGETVERVRVVTDAEGMPLQRADALISEEDFAALQVKLDGNASKRTSNRRDRAELLGVVSCECGRAWYRNPRANEAHTSYRCSSYAKPGQGCGNSKSFNARKLEELVRTRFLATVGHAEIVRREFIPGMNHDKEIAALGRALADLRDDRAAGLYADDLGKAEYREQYAKLSSRRTELVALPSTPDRWEEVATGQTYAERWATLTTDAERNAEYIAAGVKVIVRREAVPAPVNVSNVRKGERSVTTFVDRAEIVIPTRIRKSIQERHGEAKAANV